ncbi:unnamed protein product [Rhizoctonia solani]|uniref:RING-type domain-containing protein n=1 Tax=Rhizoctonia solani TaxID=456999 RepID=A0A8H3E2C8_9AGAM|nr:unnamed protein product [Rhizoctonia solani]
MFALTSTTMPSFVRYDHRHDAVIDLTRAESAPLPPPSTSRTPKLGLPSQPSHRDTYLGTQSSTTVSFRSRSVVSTQTSNLVPLSFGSRELDDINGDYLDYDSSSIFSVDPHPSSTPTTNHDTTNKRKLALPDEDEDDPEDQGPLLSEYLCPICYSPPQSAVITLCGHILCGSCLHGATTTRQAAARPLCPVCRTPLPNLQFAFPSIQFNLNPNVPLNVMNDGRLSGMGAGVDTAGERWDPARSGVIGEILTVNEV